MPLDSRQVVETLDDLLALDENILYNGIQVYVNELDVRYQYHEDYNETDTGNWKKISSDIEAENVKFSDGENLQQKLDDGSLGGGSGMPNYYELKFDRDVGCIKMKEPENSNYVISLTDNMGGHIEIYGASLNGDYKTIKAVRLSHSNLDTPNASIQGIKDEMPNGLIDTVYYYNGYLFIEVYEQAVVRIVGLEEEPTTQISPDDRSNKIPVISVVERKIVRLRDIGMTRNNTPMEILEAMPNYAMLMEFIYYFKDMPTDDGVLTIARGGGLTEAQVIVNERATGRTWVAKIEDTTGNYDWDITGWNELSGDSSITLTQNEYDALTDEEKNNGITYFISDADTDLTIDEEVNEESVNLVTNKAVATAIKEQIDDTQAAADKTYSSVKIESLIDDTTYTPNMYDRNANGDMPVVPFDRLANNMFLIQNQALIKEGEVYDEDYVGGWVYTSANDVLTKEMFNKIKCIVAIPGVLRIGIMNEHLWDANPRYSTCLVKWLVSDFVAYTGLKEYDIEDTILEEGQYLFIECRAGESSWYYNSSTEAVKIGDVTYPASSCTSGLNVADKLDSTTNNVVFKSQSVTSTSARTYFGNGQYNVGSKYRTNFLDRHCTSTARTAPKPQDQSLYQGGLNIGLYRRTKYSNTIFCKCVENSMNISWVGDDSVTKIYAAIGQEEIVGKSVYAFKLDVNTPGNLTIYHLKGNTLDTIEIIDKYTHYVRAKGLQTIHLPFDIKLKEGEYIGFGGLHFKSTSDNIVRHGCKWQYMAGDQTTGSCGWMNTIGKTGFYSIGVSMTSYPETFTSFETNGSYLNIELICRGEKRSPLEDKYISFTGDSITTFANFVTTQTGYPEGNSAGDNAYYYPASGKVINNVDATWWGILARDNRMQILRNDAWSGSRVSSTTGSTDTKCLCGTERRYYLRNTYEPTTKTTYPFGIPEIVVNMIGTNDLSGNVELGEEMFKGVVGAEDEYKTILSAYSLMCRRFAAEYNKNGAKIVHFIIPRGSDWGYANSNGVTIADLSLAFERIAKAWGQYFIPLSYFTGFNPAQYKKNTCPTASVHRNFRGTEFSSADGLHPNVVGMEIIANAIHTYLNQII